MTILEHIDNEMYKLSKFDGVELEKAYIQLRKDVDARLDRLKEEKGLEKVIHRNESIVGVINLNKTEW